MFHLEDPGHRHRMALGTTKSGSLVRGSRGAGLVAIVMLLAGCASETTSGKFCSDYENAWNSFADTRDIVGSSRDTVLAARDQLLEDWDHLTSRQDASADVSAMVPVVSAAFTQAWNASSPSEQRAYQLSWANSQGYIALQCDNAGHAISFQGMAVPLGPPTQNDSAP